MPLQLSQLQDTHEKAVFGLYLQKVVAEYAEKGMGGAKLMLKEALHDYEHRYDHEKEAVSQGIRQKAVPQNVTASRRGGKA